MNRDRQRNASWRRRQLELHSITGTPAARGPTPSSQREWASSQTKQTKALAGSSSSKRAKWVPVRRSRGFSEKQTNWLRSSRHHSAPHVTRSRTSAARLLNPPINRPIASIPNQSPNHQITQSPDLTVYPSVSDTRLPARRRCADRTLVHGVRTRRGIPCGSGSRR